MPLLGSILCFFTVVTLFRGFTVVHSPDVGTRSLQRQGAALSRRRVRPPCKLLRQHLTPRLLSSALLGCTPPLAFSIGVGVSLRSQAPRLCTLLCTSCPYFSSPTDLSPGRRRALDGRFSCCCSPLLCDRKPSLASFLYIFCHALLAADRRRRGSSAPLALPGQLSILCEYCPYSVNTLSPPPLLSTGFSPRPRQPPPSPVHTPPEDAARVGPGFPRAALFKWRRHVLSRTSEPSRPPGRCLPGVAPCTYSFSDDAA
mmetsp:Transcript_16328/g.32676  ORF Transcript_16328/g.32676 Transcript_16328/m.32676 type:complete len:257 (-) Transcript_16328:208-978(-)